MKLWFGVITDKIQESKAFYTRVFGCEILYESEWFVLLGLGASELGFMLPDHPSQAPVFQRAFSGQGVWVAVDVSDVDAEYRRIQSLGVPIELSLRDEPWGDRHFVVLDPNGVGVDVVSKHAPT